MAKSTVADKPVVDELEWKAEWFGNRFVQERIAYGFHNPQAFHISPFKVAPPLRADGKTYCEACDASLVDYKDSDEKNKAHWRKLVAVVKVCEEEFGKLA